MTEQETKRQRLSKKWVINAFVMNTPGLQNPGLWSHPLDQGSQYKTIKYWQDLAVKLEAAHFTGIFIADVLGPYDVYKGPHNLGPPLIGAAQLPTNDPQLIVPVMAAVTKSIGFGITVSTTYEHPYDLARRLSTLDHLTEGRVGWNIVTSYLLSAAKAHGLPEQIDKSIRYKKADEYLDVVYKLWEGSWKDDAVVLDKKKNIYTDPERVRYIKHKGEFYQVEGVHLAEPSKQRTPVLFQAGLSPDGKEFASKHAEGIFVSGNTPEKVRDNVNDIRAKAAAKGRDPNSIKIVFGILVVVGETDESAREKFNSYIKYANLEGALALLGGWTGVDISQAPDDVNLKTLDGPTGDFFRKTVEEDSITKSEFALSIALGGRSPEVIGSAKTVADKLEKWIEISGIDGFNFKYISVPDTFDDIIKYLLPELKKRGHFDDEYYVPGGTWRENLTRNKGGRHLSKDHYGYKFKW